MDKLHSWLKTKNHSGVYWLKSAATPGELEKAAKEEGFAYFHIEGQKLTKKEQFLNHAALAMHFPEYFGDNWDAFEDCLMDLSWIEADGFVIVYDHVDVFAEHQPQHFDTLLEILREATEYWHGQGKPMLALLRGKHRVDDIEPLS
jgi:RNAse (barnase) inhibitor barstar